MLQKEDSFSMENIFAHIGQKVSYFFKKISIKFNRDNFLATFKNTSYVLITICTLLCSGYCFTFLNTDTFASTLISIITFLISSIMYFFLSNFSSIKSNIKNKKINVSFCVLFSIGVVSLISLLVNHEQQYLMTYVGFGLTILNGFLISELINLRKFLKMFVDFFFVLTVVSIFLYLIFIITRLDLLPFFGVTNGKNQYFYNYFFVNFINPKNLRFQSLFWEPGLFCTFALISILFLSQDFNPVSIIKSIIFVVGIILTKSSFGYLSLLAVILYLIYKPLKTKSTTFSSIFLLISLLIFSIAIIFINPLIDLLSKISPAVFGKLSLSEGLSVSFSTRLLSPVVNFKIFLKSPFFGVGLNNFGNIYNEIINDNEYIGLIDAQTSTTTMLMGCLGIFGLLPYILIIIAIFKIKNLDFFEKIYFIFLVLLFTNKEPHYRLLFDWILFFSLIKCAFSNSGPLLEKTSFTEEFIGVFLCNEDEAVVRRNAFFSLSIKGFALILGFIAIPIYNLYFSSSQNIYGIWIAVLSILSWIMTFDLGLGNGLKNNLIKNDFLKVENQGKTRKLISSTYLFTSFVSVAFLIVGLVLIWTLDISRLFKGSDISIGTLRAVMSLILLSICLEFVLKNIIYIYQAMQKQFFASIPPLLTTFLLIIFTAFIRFETFDKQLMYLSLFYLCACNLPYIFITLLMIKWLISLKTKSTDLQKVRFTIKDLMTVSIGFFIIQICFLFINASNSILISSSYGSEYTTIFEYYNKFFSMLYTGFTMISLPYWAMIAKAKAENNIVLIKKMIKRIIIYAVIFAILGIIILISMQVIFDVWINQTLVNQLKADYMVALLFYINSLLLIMIAVCTTLLNGLSAIKVQLIGFIFAAVLKFSTFYLFKHVMFESDWRVAILSSIVALAPLTLYLALLSYKNIRGLSINEVYSV